MEESLGEAEKNGDTARIRAILMEIRDFRLRPALAICLITSRRQEPMTEKDAKQRRDPALNKPEMDDLNRLIAAGKEKGYLTLDEVNEALPEEIVTAEKLDDMMMIFDEMDIEIVDSEQQVQVVRGPVSDAEGIIGGGRGRTPTRSGCNQSCDRSGQDVFA